MNMQQSQWPSLPEVFFQDQKVVFRPIVPEDAALLFQLYASTRSDVDPLPWTPEQKHAFLAQQFHAQHTHYQQHYPDAWFMVMQINGLDFGRLYLHHTSREHRLMEVTLLPSHRNQGFGTALMQALMAHAEKEGLPLTLHVETFNPAYRLYQRLGFQDVREHGLYMFMERPVAASVV